MSFWSDPAAKEPLRKNKWLISFTRLLKDYTFALKTCTKPSYTIENSSHVLLNYTFNFPKRIVWQPLSITMASVINNPTQVGTSERFLMNSLNQKLANYKDATNNGVGNLLSFPDPLANNTGEYNLSKDQLISLFEGPIIRLIQLDSDGQAVENWLLYNPYVSEVKFGDLSYDNEDIVDTTFTITYDYAKIADNLMTTFLQQQA